MQSATTAAIAAVIVLSVAACASGGSHSHKAAVKKSPYRAYVAAGKTQDLKPISRSDAQDNAHFLCQGSASSLRQKVSIVLHNADDVAQMKAQLQTLVKAYCPARAGKTSAAVAAAKLK